MAKRRIINTKLWSDSYVTELDPSEKLMFIYLLTNPYTNISGAYEISFKQIALDTGFDKEMVEKIIKRFEDDGKVFYRHGYILVRNFIKHQELNQKVVKGIENEAQNLPSDLKNIVYDSLSDLNLNSNLNSNIKSQATSDDETKFYPVDLDLAHLLSDLIKENMPTFKTPDIVKWADQIRLMRERDGRTEEQIKWIIKWCQKDNFWKANILSTKKLREKFDTLVAQAKRKVDVRKEKIGEVLL